MIRKLDLQGIDRLTKHKLSDAYGVTYTQVKPYVEWLNMYCQEYEIDTPLRMAAFLAQIGYESGRMRYVEEIASGKKYEGRKDLGNTQKGDGMRFKGRGLIQITGRANYTELSNDVGINFVSQPLLLSLPEYAVMSACWFWDKRKLNKYADAGEFKEITRRINGGYNGLEDREKLYHNCKRMLNI
ncbi:MAG: glycoside hydrolase family 19 protein [Bacteroidales bacterium]|nr:glycoside hydrolase family 19 protein [Bacteroidales bacterium]